MAIEQCDEEGCAGFWPGQRQNRRAPQMAASLLLGPKPIPRTSAKPSTQVCRRVYNREKPTGLEISAQVSGTSPRLFRQPINLRFSANGRFDRFDQILQLHRLVFAKIKKCPTSRRRSFNAAITP